ncbi:MAG: hypothetical protein M1820_002308 [Bogoriella megaspora]|nr:MAG: hypothetical protein M1820_002308 [Bogoriella megaspora]
MASASIEVPEHPQMNQDLAKNPIEDNVVETNTGGKIGRSFMPRKTVVNVSTFFHTTPGLDLELRQRNQYPQKLQKQNKAQYSAKQYGPVMHVTIIDCRQDTTGRWHYQAQDTDGNPVRQESKDQPDWIPETKLKKLQPVTVS